MRRVLGLTTALLLVGCAGIPHPEGKPYPELTFAQMPPLGINVSSVEVFPQPGQAIPVHEQPDDFIPSLEKTTRNYLSQRLQPSGISGVLNVHIDELKITHKLIKTDSSVLNWAGLGMQDEYRVSVTLRVMAGFEPGRGQDGYRVRFDKSFSVPENASLASREEKQVDFLEEYFEALDERVVNALDRDMNLVTHN